MAQIYKRFAIFYFLIALTVLGFIMPAFTRGKSPRHDPPTMEGLKLGTLEHHEFAWRISFYSAGVKKFLWSDMGKKIGTRMLGLAENCVSSDLPTVPLDQITCR